MEHTPLGPSRKGEIKSDGSKKDSAAGASEEPSYFHLENKIGPSHSAQPPFAPISSPEHIPKSIVPPVITIVPPGGALSGRPSPKQQSWGALISIIIIVLMITIGAFYAWGKRIAQEQVLTATSTVQY